MSVFSKKMRKMKKYITKTESIDPERGNCLLLYTDKVRPLTKLTDNELGITMRALLLWFIGKITVDEALGEITEKCKNGLLSDIVESIITAQQRHVQKYLAECERKKWRRERNAPCFGVMPHVETGGKMSCLESPRVYSSEDKTNNYN